jgi:hypothetical protein
VFLSLALQIFLFLLSKETVARDFRTAALCHIERSRQCNKTSSIGERTYLLSAKKYLREYGSIFEAASACKLGDPGVLFAEKNEDRKSSDTNPLRFKSSFFVPYSTCSWRIIWLFCYVRINVS